MWTASFVWQHRLLLGVRESPPVILHHLEQALLLILLPGYFSAERGGHGHTPLSSVINHTDPFHFLLGSHAVRVVKPFLRVATEEARWQLKDLEEEAGLSVDEVGQLLL